jgi:transcriptional regulator with XRE-family HTH domain
MRLVKNSTSIIKDRGKTQTALRKVWDQKKKELELTQVKVAEQLGIKQSSFNQYLNGIIPLNTNFVLKITDILKVEPGELAPELFRYVPLKTKGVTVPVLFAVGSFEGAQGVINVHLAEQSKTADAHFAVYINESLRSPLLPAKAYLVCQHVEKKEIKPTDFIWVIYKDLSEKKPNELLQVLQVQNKHLVCVDPVTGTQKLISASSKADVHSISKVAAIQMPQ